MFDAETVAAAIAPETLRAAGIVFRAKSTGRVLYLQRVDTGEWCGAGGKIEDGETPIDAAIRECAEEMGELSDLDPQPLARTVSPTLDFTAFIQDVPDEFAPTLNDEHTAWAWADPDNPPQPVHANMATVVARLFADELGIARLMAFSGLASPQKYGAVWLFDMRITGTGAAYRMGDKEFVWRDPSLYCNEDFLARCNGLPVVFEHPEKAVLNSKEYADRNVGSIFLPYLKGDEPWGIAKVYDDETAELMAKIQLSTSPGVVLRPGDLENKVELDGGKMLLIEGRPALIDHLAICAQGVWDKGSDPVGIRLDSIQGACMADEADREEDKKADAADPMQAIADSIAALAGRMDAYEAKKSDADEAPEDKKADAEEPAEEKKADEAEDKEEAKADSVPTAIAAQIAALEARIPRALSDAELNELSEVQARADSVAQAFGHAPLRPMQGEAPVAYRRRLAAKYRDHSPTWKDVDVSALPVGALAIAEAAIFADAVAKADSAVDVADGMLMERRRQDSTGRTIYEYVGSPSAWMDQFKIIPKFASRFNTDRRGA